MWICANQLNLERIVFNWTESTCLGENRCALGRISAIKRELSWIGANQRNLARNDVAASNRRESSNRGDLDELATWREWSELATWLSWRTAPYASADRQTVFCPIVNPASAATMTPARHLSNLRPIRTQWQNHLITDMSYALQRYFVSVQSVLDHSESTCGPNRYFVRLFILLDNKWLCMKSHTYITIALRVWMSKRWTG